MTNPFDSNGNYAAGQSGGNNPFGGSDYDSGSYTADQGGFGTQNSGASYNSSGANMYGGSPNGYGAGYQQQPGGHGQGGLMVSPVDAMDSISQAFKGTLDKPVMGMLAAAVHGVIPFLLIFGSLIYAVLTAPTETTSSYGSEYYYSSETTGEPTAAGIAVMVVGFTLGFLYLLWAMANFYCAARKIADGQEATFGDYFKGGDRFGVAFVYLLFFILFFVGSLLFVLPGLAVVILFWAAPIIKANDPSKSIGECFSESFSMVTANFGQTLLFYIVFTIVNSVLCAIPVIGALFSFPVSALGYTLFVRSAQKRPARRWA